MRSHNSIFWVLLSGSLIVPISAETADIRVGARDAVVNTKIDRTTAKTREVHDIASRNATTRLLVETANDPIVVAVLFAGGKGAMNISRNGKIGWGNGNFLVRSRPYFLERGITTAIIDAPTDQKYDLRHGFRGSANHATDIGAAITHLRSTYNLPVWLIGTSRGTNSVVNAAVRLAADCADGIVLTSSMLTWNEKGDNLLGFDLEKISGPVLISHHRNDECHVTPPEGVRNLQSRLTNGGPMKVAWYRGGYAVGIPCHAAHYHGFNGIEEQVVADIVAWIKQTTP